MSTLCKLFTKIFIILICYELFIPIETVKYRIIGGSTTTINKQKYIVSLRRRNGQFFCGGSLVRSRYVVTAAHCVKGLRSRNVYVHGGATYLRQTGIKRSVSKIIIPKSFSMKTGNMDVAVLKLSKPMRGRSVSTIRLCSRKSLTNKRVHVSGWGFTKETNIRPSQQLRTVRVRVQSRGKCRSSYRRKLKISDTMMCASVPGRKDSCSGDSGGPLVHRKQLCGIVSLGIGCGRKKYPGIYTMIRARRVWRFLQKALKS